MTHILIAPDKFKGTLHASEVAREISEAIREMVSDASVCLHPMADGGEGTAEIVASQLGLLPATIRGHDAVMRPVEIRYYEAGTTCAVDCASVIGLALLGNAVRSPWEASSYGLGEFIGAMLDKGHARIIVGLGGSATVDGGIGMLQALGANFFDSEGTRIAAPIRADSLATICRVDFSEIDRQRISNAVSLLADVDLPLLPSAFSFAANARSSLMFARQKGITELELPQLYYALKNYVSVVEDEIPSRDDDNHFHGAAGGLGYAFRHILHCHAEAGADSLLDDSLFSSPKPDLVITGEGCFDSQSFAGKVTGTVYEKAASLNIPTVIVAGCSTLKEIPSGIRLVTTMKCPGSQATSGISHHDALISLRKALRRKLPVALKSLNILF